MSLRQVLVLADEDMAETQNSFVLAVSVDPNDFRLADVSAG